MFREGPVSQYLGAAVIVVLGAILLLPLIGDWIEVGAPIVDIQITKLLLPLLYFGILIAYVRWKLTQTDDGSVLVRIAGWCLLMAILMPIVVWFSLIGQVSDPVETFHILNRAALRGAVIGLVIGHYSANNHVISAQLREYSEQLELVNRLLRHDIRNDVMVISGLAEILYDEYQDELSIEEASIRGNPIELIGKRANHIAELTNTASQLSTDVRYRDQEVRLKDLLETTVDRARADHPEAEFDLVTDVGSEVTVAADDAVSAIFENLLHNAVVHNDQPTPRVTMTAESEPETITIEIADNGPGLPESSRAALFEPGEKGEESSGSGLGLYLVETLVNRYRGTIHVESNEPRGTVFVVELNRGATTAGEGVRTFRNTS